MNKSEFLKKAVHWKAHWKKEFLFSMLTICRTRENNFRYPGQIVVDDIGFWFYDEEGVLVKIEDGVKNQPLFNHQEPLTVDNTWLTSISETPDKPLVTKAGTFIMNAFCLYPAFGKKLPYVAGKSSVEGICAKIAIMLKSKPEDDSKRMDTEIYTDEYKMFLKSLQIFERLSKPLVVTATPKNTVAPPGIKEFRAQLVEKYGEQLKDPVKLADFEGELKAYTKKYMEGDPSNGVFFSGKAENIAYKKLYLTSGDEQKFKETVHADPIITSLSEGIPNNPKQFSMVMNGQRIGSYFRGAETIKGGVTAKILLRAANDIAIIDTDCGSKVGLYDIYTEQTIKHLVGRYVLLNGKPVLVKDLQDAKNYIGKLIEVRSVQFCHMEQTNQICRVCTGDPMMQYKEGLTIPLTEESTIILYASMKKMHGAVLSVNELNLDEIIF